MTHQPVLLHEVIKFLNPRPGDFIIDGTVDGGGHMAAILPKIGQSGRFLGIDWDRRILEKAKKRIAVIPNHQFLISKLILVSGNYADLPEILKGKKLPKADGLLLDLGFSSEQIGGSGRGFSFGPQAADEPLIMTYSDERRPVAQILREVKENDLADIIYKFSGERFSRRIAKAIKEKEKIKPIITAGELRDVIASAVPKSYEKGRMPPATRTFQALRIYANDELGNLEKILCGLKKILKPGGRAAVISFHSLEDRIVKNIFREMDKNGDGEVVTKKPVKPTKEEIDENPRCHSAKLRVLALK